MGEEKSCFDDESDEQVSFDSSRVVNAEINVVLETGNIIL